MTVIVAEYIQASADMPVVGDWTVITKCYHKLSGHSRAFMYVGRDMYFTESLYKSSFNLY
jgi:hypothetical protein